ncbi:hypothetical protein LY28_02138 [Ruminiclostridium sufflavum DSM 19573]|uniref:Uncharacterized protein n=1 Tax=Ruminiclostridium sufflavum DSM 19573 TaxID=1121337 RepID=A0A318XPB0_9FIRM|nr:hypothetical protein [Ruminiclostridium sufflavum]PYG87468.1 hypothetical protein LY28_02138 [Ruminiclostridium sufflavum DSM 19573]
MNDENAEKVVLPVKYPVITSYTADAHMLAILYSYPSTEEWIFNNYINLWGEEPSHYNNYAMLRFHSWSIKKACPYFKLSYFDKSFFSSDITEFIISKINAGKYVTIFYDQYYIKCSMRYKKMHAAHEMLIYGYDRTLKVFFIADFLHNYKYAFETESFDCIESSITNMLESELFLCTEIAFCKSDYKFSNYFLVNSLKNFLYSQNNVAENENVFIAQYESEPIKRGEYVFGIKNYGLLKEKLSEVIYNNNYDFRSLHVVFDHKVMMCELLKYLANTGMIAFNDSMIEDYSNIKNISRSNRNLLIKFTVTKDKKLIDKIIDNINIMEALEVKAITYLIKKASAKL